MNSHKFIKLLVPGTLMGYHGGRLTKAPVSFVVFETDSQG